MIQLPLPIAFFIFALGVLAITVSLKMLVGIHGERVRSQQLVRLMPVVMRLADEWLRKNPPKGGENITPPGPH